MKHPERTLAVALLIGVSAYAASAFGLKTAVVAPISAALCVCAFFFAFFTYGRKIIKSLVAAVLAAAFCVLGTVGGYFLVKNRAAAESLVSDEEHRIVATVESVSYVTSFDSRVVPMAMCAPAAFSPFDSRFRTEAFAVFGHFRSDQPKGACLIVR